MSDKLIKAARKGDYATVRKLLDNGADVDYLDKDGHTSIHWASVIGHTEVLRLLIERGGSVNTANIRGYTPLMAACARGIRRVVAILIEHGADGNARACDGETALMNASGQQEDAEILRLLLDNGARVNDTSERGGTALLGAAWAGRVDNVQVLMEHGADPEIAMNDGRTPLSSAFEKRDWEVVALLKRTSDPYPRE